MIFLLRTSRSTRCSHRVLGRSIVARSTSAVSSALFREASKFLPGGNTRHTLSRQPHPTYAASGSGAYVTDVDGNQLVDFVNNYGSLILGHNNAEVKRTCMQQLEKGTVFGMPTASELELARILVDRVPCLESVRFCNSGTEALMLGVKAARARTGKLKIAKFEGCYHGGYDYVGVSEHPEPAEAGTATAPLSVASDKGSSSPRMLEDVVVLPWNDLESCKQRLSEHAHELACCIVCPANLSLWMSRPAPGFLEGLFQHCRSLGVLYLADEVLAFSVGYRGAHAMVAPGVCPDLMALGKIIGGGFPVGAVGGRRDIMDFAFTATKGGRPPVYHGGTFNGNAMSMAAGAAVMRQLTPSSFEYLGGLREKLVARVGTAMAELDLHCHVGGCGRFFVLNLGRGDATQNWRELHHYKQQSGWLDAAQAWANEMGRCGMLVSPRAPFGVLSLAMTDGDVDAFVGALQESLSKLRAQGVQWATPRSS